MYNPIKQMQQLFGQGISIQIHDIEVPDRETILSDRQRAEALINDPETDPDWSKKWVRDQNGNVFELLYVDNIPYWKNPDTTLKWFTSE